MRELNTGKIKIMLLNILNSANFALSGEAETGSAGEQPVRNNLTNRNAQEVGNFSTSDILNILIIYALKNSKVTHSFLLDLFVSRWCSTERCTFRKGNVY
jgi:hypothetical protein